MRKSELQSFQYITEARLKEKLRLGDSDANAPYITHALWAINELVKHALETHPETTHQKKKATKAKRRRKKSAG